MRTCSVCVWNAWSHGRRVHDYRFRLFFHENPVSFFVDKFRSLPRSVWVLLEESIKKKKIEKAFLNVCVEFVSGLTKNERKRVNKNRRCELKWKSNRIRNSNLGFWWSKRNAQSHHQRQRCRRRHHAIIFKPKRCDNECRCRAHGMRSLHD